MIVRGVTLREMVEEALGAVDFDRDRDRRKAISMLVGAVSLHLQDERRSAVEALSSMPRAQEALRKLWKMNGGS